MPSNGFMSHINRNLLILNNSEILNQFNWDIQFIRWPEAVYNPGEELFKSRLKSIGQMPENTHDVASVEVPGNFSVLQTGHLSREPFDLTLSFQDYEDSSISYFGRDWQRKCEDPETKFGYPKSQLVMDLDVIQLTNSRAPVRKWHFYSGLITNVNDGITFDRTKEPLGRVEIGIKFEWWDDEFLNH